MGLHGAAWLKTLLRTHPQLRHCMHWANGGGGDATVSTAPTSATIEHNCQVALIELMLHKHVLVKGCQSLAIFAKRWRNLVEAQLRRFPNAQLLVLLFDDETNVPLAKGKTQEARRTAAGGGTAGFTDEELVLLGPFRYLCNAEPQAFDQRVRALFEGEAMRRKLGGLATVSAFEVYMQKHMLTRGLREDELEFATRGIIAGPYQALGGGAGTGAKSTCTSIVIDRGVWRDSFRRDLATDPHGGGEEPWGSVAASFAHRSAAAGGELPDADCQHHLAALEAIRQTMTAAADAREWNQLVVLTQRAQTMVEYASRIYDRACAVAADPMSARLCQLRSRIDAVLSRVDRDVGFDPDGATQSCQRALDYAQAAMEHMNGRIAATRNTAITRDGTVADPQDAARRAWILVDRWGARELAAMHDQHLVGEADLKIARYARLFACGPQRQRLCAVCHDTDALPILLLAVHDLIPSTQCDIEGGLWLDMTTPTDDQKTALKKALARGPPPAPNLLQLSHTDGRGGVQRLPNADRLERGHQAKLARHEAEIAALRRPLPGMVDMVALWRALHDWLASEFPGVHNPIEVFCLLLASMGTDYVHNPPHLGPGSLWGAFAKKALHTHLSRAVAVDGRAGAAVDPRSYVHQGSTLEAVAKAGTAQAAEQGVVAALMRDTVLPPATTTTRPASPCTAFRHVSVREPSVVTFLLHAYNAYRKSKPETWPSQAWMQAEVRRLGWQLAYWRDGDTLGGRQFEDEMDQTLADESTGAAAAGPPCRLSVHGWVWRPSDETDSVSQRPLSAEAAVTPSRKRKAGCLGRTKQPGCVAEPAESVLPLAQFRARQMATFERNHATGPQKRLRT